MQRIWHTNSRSKPVIRRYFLAVALFLLLALEGCFLFGSELRGIASYYGPGFHGRKTANGEIFDQYAMTAAHKTLPFNTRVVVRNLENDKMVVVRINDRGPFIWGRVIDLSYGAAQELDMVQSGIVDVQIVPLPEELDGAA